MKHLSIADFCAETSDTAQLRAISRAGCNIPKSSPVPPQASDPTNHGQTRANVTFTRWNRGRSIAVSGEGAR